MTPTLELLPLPEPHSTLQFRHGKPVQAGVYMDLPMVPLHTSEAMTTYATANVAPWRERAERAEAEVERLRKDAERYRWLRDPASNLDCIHTEPRANTLSVLSGKELDTAIDTAMKERAP